MVASFTLYLIPDLARLYLVHGRPVCFLPSTYRNSCALCNSLLRVNSAGGQVNGRHHADTDSRQLHSSDHGQCSCVQYAAQIAVASQGHVRSGRTPRVLVTQQDCILSFGGLREPAIGTRQYYLLLHQPRKPVFLARDLAVSREQYARLHPYEASLLLGDGSDRRGRRFP